MSTEITITKMFNHHLHLGACLVNGKLLNVYTTQADRTDAKILSENEADQEVNLWLQHNEAQIQKIQHQELNLSATESQFKNISSTIIDRLCSLNYWEMLYSLYDRKHIARYWEFS